MIQVDFQDDNYPVLVDNDIMKYADDGINDLLLAVIDNMSHCMRHLHRRKQSCRSAVQ